MWEYTFNDYKLYCDLLSLKASNFKNLLEFKRFIKYLDKDVI